MGQIINKLVGLIRDFGRKPYMYGTTRPPYQTSLKGGGESASYREQMSKVSEYAIRTQVEYESSQLKKPYMSDGFPDMEHFYSPFNTDLSFGWDPLDRSPLSFLGGESPSTPPVASDGYCYEISRSCNITHTTDLDAGVTYLKVYHGPEEDEDYEVDIDITPADKHRIIAVQDEYIKNFGGNDYVKITVYWDMIDCQNDLEFTVLIKWQNLCDRIKGCEEEVTIECEPCRFAEDFAGVTLDPINASRPSGYADITVTGGAGPYSWEIKTVGHGGSWIPYTDVGNPCGSATEETAIRTNRFYASDCGGNLCCGSIEIEVTDACGSTITFYVHITNNIDWYTVGTHKGSDDAFCGPGGGDVCATAGCGAGTATVPWFGGLTTTTYSGATKYTESIGVGKGNNVRCGCPVTADNPCNPTHCASEEPGGWCCAVGASSCGVVKAYGDDGCCISPCISYNMDGPYPMGLTYEQTGQCGHTPGDCPGPGILVFCVSGRYEYSSQCP